MGNNGSRSAKEEQKKERKRKKQTDKSTGNKNTVIIRSGSVGTLNLEETFDEDVSVSCLRKTKSREHLSVKNKRRQKKKQRKTKRRVMDQADGE